MDRGRGEGEGRGGGEEVSTSMTLHTAGWRLSGEWRCDERQRRRSHTPNTARLGPEGEGECVGQGRSVRDGLLREATKSSVPRLNLSGSWQQGHSAAYNTPYLIQVVCK